MAVYLKKEVLGISESDDALSLNEFDSGNAFADVDTTVWGSALKENSTRGTMEFTKKYLNLVFEVHRDSFYDFLRVSSGQVILQGSRRTVSFVHNTLGNGMYTSQSNDTVDSSKSNKEVVIRIRIPTADIYNIGTIKKISCKITTNRNHNLGHTWDLLNDSISIHKGYKWYKENGILLYRDFIDRGGTYSQKTISPKSEYDGDIKIFSETYYEGDQSGERYFTPSSGKIKVKISKMNFFNSDNIRIPSHLFFEGLDSNGASKTETVTLINEDDNGNYNDLKNTTEEEFDSSKLGGFSKINKAFLCFGGDTDNKMSAYTFSDGFLNTAYQKNVLLNFNKNTCVNNTIIHMIENGSVSTQMKAELTGTISVPENFPFEFTTTAKLKHSENVNQDDLDITDFLSISNQTITLNFNKNYAFKEDRSNRKLSFEDGTPPKKGTYLLKCSVINKLNNKSEEYTFNFNDDYKIEITSISDEYMAFGGPTPQIRYIVATKTTDEFVNGNIIIPEETLVFPSISNDNNFRLYKTDTYQSSTPSIEEYYVGLHPSYHDNIDKKSIISVINQRKEVGYDTLKGWMDHTSTDEQKLMYIAYLLKSSEIKIHTQPYIFTLGRIQPPIFDNKKIKDGILQYFLIDNGTDKILSTKENNGISRINLQRIE